MQCNSAVVISAYPLRPPIPIIVVFIIPLSLLWSCTAWSEISYTINTDIAAVVIKNNTVVGQNFPFMHQIDTYNMLDMMMI